MAEIKQYLKALRTHRLSRKADYAGCPCNAHKCDQYKNIHLSEYEWIKYLLCSKAPVAGMDITAQPGVETVFKIHKVSYQ
jgi:hypothetical protein